MDYCYQCRRHLNGALACAGCGTPAEELRQQAPVTPGPQNTADPGRKAGGDEEHGESGDLSEGEDALLGHHPPYEAPGRTERRRTEQRRARGKRGRVVVIGTLGVVLAAGAVGVGQFALRDQGSGAATVVKEETSLNGDTVRPPSDGPEAPAAPESAAPPSESAEDSPSPSDSADPSPTTSSDTSASATASATATRSAEAPTSSGHSHRPHGHSGHSDTPSASSGAPTSADPSSGSPTPHPSETHKCTHILWWCS